uniref:Uncharacterized protein n=1 Tax=Amphimedon queenslandica TaxID=400682 RepID=A0A1X7TVY6_AMPQE
MKRRGSFRAGLCTRSFNLNPQHGSIYKLRPVAHHHMASDEIKLKRLAEKLCQKEACAIQYCLQ